jgi:hypothetical protein
MESNEFDRLARSLTREAPRRALLGGLFGGVLAAITGATASAVNRRKRKRRGGDGSDGSEEATGEIELPPGTLAGGVWDETINICHFDPERGEYRVMAVPTVTIPDYLNAGDTLYIDCCVDADCVGLACFTSSGCIEGACAYDPVPGAACDLGDGTFGVCDQDGVCVASVTAPAPATDTTTPAPAPAPAY